MSRESFDPIAVIESAYRLELPDRAWLAGLVASMSSGCNRGLGVGGGLWERTNDGRLASKADVDPTPAHAEISRRLYALVPADRAHLYYKHAPMVTLASRMKSDPLAMQGLTVAGQALGVAVCDLWALTVGDGTRNGILFAAFAGAEQRLSKTEEGRWVRIATHVGAALRLRTYLQSGPHRPAAAVLGPGGKILHASGEATEPSAREALRTAVRAIDRARGSLRRRDPDEALAIWRALVAGRWGVVDWVDSDGRRFLVAHDNGIDGRGPRALTGRERDVAEFVVHGRTNSEIAYALGLSVGTVNRLVRGTLRKLGRARRGDLASVFGAAHMNVASLDEAGSVVAVSAAGRSAELWEKLSGAERDVVVGLLDGESNRNIARRRGRSVRTVANQLAVVYARLGVRGRTELAALLGPAPDAVANEN